MAASQAQQCRQVVGSVKQSMQNELRMTSEPTAIKIPRSPDASTIKQNTTAAGERSMFTELCNCSEIHSKAFTGTVTCTKCMQSKRSSHTWQCLPSVDLVSLNARAPNTSWAVYCVTRISRSVFPSHVVFKQNGNFECNQNRLNPSLCNVYMPSSIVSLYLSCPFVLIRGLTSSTSTCGKLSVKNQSPRMSTSSY